MIYISCLDLKNSNMFFIISELGEEKHSELIDILLDNKIKMKSCTREDIESINPFLQDSFDIFHFKTEEASFLDFFCKKLSLKRSNSVLETEEIKKY